MGRHIARDADAVGALADELRRSLYLFVRNSGKAVTREEAARAAGISRKLAAFHLDKLAERGLLRFSYARPPGRGGRGAGRPAKYYETSDREIEVTIPERRYDLLGSILLRALRARTNDEDGAAAAREAARDAGLEIGQAERRRRGIPPVGPERAIAVTTELLQDRGYEPYADQDGAIRVRNCPFHALAEEDRDLVCTMNECLVEGVVRGLGNQAVQVRLDPIPGQCCVKLEVPAGRSGRPRSSATT